MIEADETFSFAGIYSDRKSGTNDKSRPGFQQMCVDVEAHKFDVVCMKSVGRFSWNDGVTQKVADRFSELDIGIIFEEDKDTLGRLHQQLRLITHLSYAHLLM